MCGKKQGGLLLLAALLFFLPAALPGEEPDRWFLISESELLRLETISMNWEHDRQAWLSQASALSKESAGLRREVSESKAGLQDLNRQLQAERETALALRQSFEASEAGRLMQLSMKNGEIAGLEQEKTREALKAERYKGQARLFLIIGIALGLSWIVYIGVKLYRRFGISAGPVS